MIVFDIETTGLYPQQHALVSLGAVEFEKPDNQFYSECRIWDGAEIMEEALEVNGFTREDITDPQKEPLEVLMHSFLKWADECREHTLAGHNVAFDQDFLKDSALRSHENYWFSHRVIDTHSLTWMHLVKQGLDVPTENQRTAINSDFVFNYVGLDLERGKHNALEDAKLTAEAIYRILYDEKLLDEFSKFPIPWLNE